MQIAGSSLFTLQVASKYLMHNGTDVFLQAEQHVNIVRHKK